MKKSVSPVVKYLKLTDSRSDEASAVFWMFERMTSPGVLNIAPKTPDPNPDKSCRRGC